MYKKLENEDTKMLAAEETPDEECTCVCGKNAELNAETKPEADTAIVHLPAHFKING